MKQKNISRQLQLKYWLGVWIKYGDFFFQTKKMDQYDKGEKRRTRMPR